MTVNTDGLSAQQIAQAVADGELSALDATEAAWRGSPNTIPC